MTNGSSVCRLSLKNIYQLLTKDDFPYPSNAIIKRSMKKGITLLSFWRGMLSDDLGITPTGERLWADKGKRPRYLSDLLNRTRPFDFYPEYFKEAAGAVNPATLLNMTDRMARFLLSADYDSLLLNARLLSFQERFCECDSDVTPAIQSYLTGLFWLKPEFDEQTDKQVFFDAYVLSVLSLHAFFGSQMNNAAMASLRTDPAFKPFDLFVVYLKRNRGAGFPPPLCLTGPACELCREPLPDDLFFGREKEAGELKVQIIRGGKMIVSGIGGIGKTELVRQVMKDVLREGVFSRVAYVQYQGNLHESFIRAFPGLSGKTALLKYQECARRLNDRGPGRTLLLIDDMNTPVSKDKTLDSLSALGCDIVMTSRLSAFGDFRVIPLGAPDYSAALSIFASHYGQRIPDSASRALDDVINIQLDRHPLMCGILGKMARARHIDLSLLYGLLDKEGLSGSYTQEAQTIRIEDTLKSMFDLSALGEPSRSLLRMFSLLPLRLYSFQTCQELFMDVSGDPDVLSHLLESLCYLGWLENSASSYSIHPVIAQAVRRDRPSLPDFPGLLALLTDKIDTRKFRQWDFVHLAYFVLKNSAAHDAATLPLIMNTADMLIERSITDAAQGLLDIAFETARSTGSFPALFDCHALKLNLLRNAGALEGAQPHVREVLRLFDSSRLSSRRAGAVGQALYFAYSLSMEEEKKQLQSLLSNTLWEGLDYAVYCQYMSMTQEFTTAYRDGIAWAEKGLQYLEELDALSSPEAAALYKPRALFCALCGMTREAEESAARYMRIISDWYDGLDWVEIAQISQYLGIAFFQTGSYEKALRYLLESLEALRKTFPGDTVDIEHTLNNIGNIYFRMKQYEEAIRYSTEAFDLHLRLNKLPNIQLATLMNNMGCIYRDSGDKQEALRLFEQALDIVYSLGETDHLCLAELSLNLALLYLQDERSPKAKPLLDVSLVIFEKNYGPDHMKTKLAKEELGKYI